MHGCGGFLGTILIGALADESVNGVKPSGVQFGIQLGSACFCVVYSMVVTVAILFVIDKLMTLKPSKDEVTFGLDMAIFGEMAYNSEMLAEWSPKAADGGSYGAPMTPKDTVNGNGKPEPEIDV